MTKVVLNDLVNLENQTSAVNTINANNAVTEAAFDNTVSRNGINPNVMGAALDMNSNRILNLPDPVSTYDPVTLHYLTSALLTNQGPAIDAGGTQYRFDSRLIATLSTVPSSITSIVTGGYSVIGDGGEGLYIKATGSTAGGFQTTNGQWWKLTGPVINVKALGAIGDGQTNDTAAFNLAISLQGQYAGVPTGYPPNYLTTVSAWTVKPIFLPNGVYPITPGGLSILYGSLYGPQATVIAANSTDAPLFSIYYRQNGAENSMCTFTLFSLLGYDISNQGSTHVSFTNTSGTGLMFQACDGATFDIKQVLGFNTGIYMNGGDYNLHQGGNQIKIGGLGQNGVGIKMNAGDNRAGSPSYGAFQEGNVITVNYAYANTTAAFYLGGALSPADGSPSEIVDNIFDIASIFPYQGDGIVCTTETSRNKFTIRSWDGGVSGPGKVLIRSTGTNNLFRVPWTDISLYALGGLDILDTATDSIGFNGSNLVGEARSNLIGSAAPTTGTWRRGDHMWNNVPSSGGPPGWVCTGAGTPGTWKAMANLA